MKALIITLLISSAVFATKYELNKTICDGKEVSISPENSVLSMIMDFHGPYKVDLLVNGVFSDSEMEFELNSKNPLTIITLQNGFYKFKKRGKSTCTIT
ncbi:MAG: hypothetical protein N4A33_05840, partial [Bacteriovoracaceae bacterium]|nr:hypothetical protein [Bacteriovoracaceae bacterium]